MVLGRLRRDGAAKVGEAGATGNRVLSEAHQRGRRVIDCSLVTMARSRSLKQAIVCSKAAGDEPPSQRRKPKVDNINLGPVSKGGTSAEYLTARIARDAPEVLERMKAGEFSSVRAAAQFAAVASAVALEYGKQPASGRGACKSGVKWAHSSGVLGARRGGLSEQLELLAGLVLVPGQSAHDWRGVARGQLVRRQPRRGDQRPALVVATGNDVSDRIVSLWLPS